MQITFNTAPLDEQVDRLEAINPELDLTELDREVTRLENIKLNDVTVNTDPLQLQVNRLEELVTSLDSITVSDSGVYRILPGYIAIACQDVCEQAGLGNSGYWHPLTTMNVSGRTVTIALTSGEYPASFVYGEFVTLFRRDHFLTIRI